MASLNEKQKRFADEYLKDLNATQAAIRAGYSKKTAESQGARLLRNVKVQEEIQKRQKAREQRTEITQDRVLLELAAIAFSKATDYAEVKSGIVQIKDTGELSEEQTKAIAGIKEGANGVEVKLNDKEKALELLGRHLGMWNDKLNLNVPALDDSIKEMEEYFEQQKKAST